MASGCVSISQVQPADTLGQGHYAMAVETAVQHVASPYLSYYPRYDTAVRYGLTDAIDVGVRVGYSGFEGQAKFLLTAPDATVALSVLPSIGGGLFPGTSGTIGIVNSSATVLAGIKHHHGNELVGGVRLGNRLMLSPERDGELELGLSVGYSARIGKRFGVMLELAVALPIVESSGASANLGTPSSYAGDAMPLSDRFIAQLNLGVSFGRQRGER